MPQARDRAAPSSPEEFEIVVSVEHTTAGTALDERLRREQARALLDLLAWHRRRTTEERDRARP